MQRQRTPARASFTASSLGALSRSRRAVAATSIPGVQMPHCAAPCRRKEFCKRSKIGARSASPSTVVISQPSTCPAAIKHEQTCSPSSKTVQAPQSPASQPTLVPARPSDSRKTRDNLSVGETAGLTLFPLTEKWIVVKAWASEASVVAIVNNSPRSCPERVRAGLELQRGGSRRSLARR